jgi:hypothetical protein
MGKTSLLCLIFLFSCNKVDINPNSRYEIAPVLKKYVDSFFLEAKLRGLDIPKENLIVKSNEINSFSDECGVCQLNTKKPEQQRTVIISFGSNLCWGSKPENDREALVFHELGHCLLNRVTHKNETFQNGSPKSIMVANNTDLYGPCIYVIDDNPISCNKTSRRKYYIDELFNPNTPTPDWAK